MGDTEKNLELANEDTRRKAKEKHYGFKTETVLHRNFLRKMLVYLRLVSKNSEILQNFQSTSA